MPIALSLELQCQEDGAIYGFTGQHAFRFWQRTWNNVIEAEMTRGTEWPADRAFTLSPLIGASEMRHRRTPLLAGDTAYIKLTCLADKATPVLRHSLQRLIGTEVELGGVRWKLRDLMGAELDNSLTGQATYHELRERNNFWRPAPQEDWKLELTTPTVVQLDNGQYLPFPLPSIMLVLWLERWAEFAPPSAVFTGGDVRALAFEIASKLALNRYRLSAIGTSLSCDRDCPESGCIGKFVFGATGLSTSESQIVSTMIEFSLYCGTGILTELGLGQTRVNRKH